MINVRGQLADDPRVDFLYKHGLNNVPTDTYLSEAEKRNPVVWATRHRTIRGRPYLFSSKINPFYFRPWLKQILKDKTKRKNIKKGRQLGLTEAGLTEFLWFLDVTPHVKGVYTMPTLPMKSRFVNTRVVPAIKDSEYLKKLTKGGLDNVDTKQIRSSFALFIGAGAERMGEGIDADFIIFDEKDRMSTKVEIAFRETLSASQYGFLREYSTPTLPDYGISKSFNQSTKYHYYQKCDKCGEWQFLTWPENMIQIGDYNTSLGVIPEGVWIICCKKCKREFNRFNEGEWVAHERSLIGVTAGYYLNQLNAAWISAATILNKKNEYKYPGMWHNYVLGMEFRDDSLLIDAETMRQCKDNERGWVQSRTKEFAAIAVGIDWGSLNWAVIVGILPDGRKVLLNTIVTKDATKGDPLRSTKEIARAIAPYEPNLIVADAGYGKDRVALMQEMYPGRAYACFYQYSGRNTKFMKPQWDHVKSFKVSIDRTVSLKLHCNDYKLPDRKWILPKEDEKLSQFIKHHCAMGIVVEEDEDTGEITERIVETDDDHLGHAANYANIAVDYLLTNAMIGAANTVQWAFIDSPNRTIADLINEAQAKGSNGGGMNSLFGIESL